MWKLLLLIPYAVMGVASALYLIRYLRFDIESDKDAQVVGGVVMFWPIIILFILAKYIGYGMRKLAMEVARWEDRRHGY